jgi:hypothetical protein
MKRRLVLLLASAAAMLAIAALARQRPQPQTLLVLEWAARAKPEMPTVAVLLEMGLKDATPTAWAGRATVTGGRIAHREGYRFRGDDKLIEPDAWEASSHRGLRVPPRQPAVAKMEGIAPVGVVLHLADLKDDAELTVEGRGELKEKAAVPLKALLAGSRVPIFGGRAALRRVSTATPVVMEKTEDDFPAAAYGPDGTLWLAYISYTLKDENRRIEQRPFKQQPADFKALYTPEFGDQLFVKYYRDGKWSESIAVTGPKEDLVRCAIASASPGTAIVAYSARRNGTYDIYARTVHANPDREGKTGTGAASGREMKLTRTSARDDAAAYLSPVLCAGPAGTVHLGCQSWSKEGLAGVFYLSGLELQENGWTARFSGGGGSGSSWHVAIAAGPEDQWQLACDTYAEGDYDIALPFAGTANRVRGGDQGKPASSSRFEARPSMCYDARGRLWIAYEEGPDKWGKDYGAQAAGKGNPLYNERSVRVVCQENGRLLRPAAELPTSRFEPPALPFEPVKTQQFEKGTRYAYPQIGIDGKGRIWLTYRQKFGSRYSTHPGSYWLTFARRLDGDKWSEPIEIHHSDGLLDHRPVLLPHVSGGLLIFHNTDGRYTTPETIDNQIYLSVVDLPGEPVEPKLVPHEAGKRNPALAQEAAAEAAAVQRIRDYRVESGGKKYQLLRGEFHRHTEISWDGGPDGSLEDMFRYGLDAAALDWIGNGDHDNGAGREYSWWLIQKFTDAYHVPGRFTPMFTYERSVAYPHGHRNCLFARRGVRTLPRLAEADPDKRVGGFHADDTKMLYRYLKELDGICASHTSATTMGTDWRDNDPDVEPIVEIYQGDRMSYEHEGAPRAGYEANSGKQPVNVAGWRPAGFINHAFEKGYRLGFEASSDHWSTHISYCIVLAERNDRAAILAALKQRHCYGATDNIIVDLHSGPHVMGDAFKSRTPKLEMTVIGTAGLDRIEILKDSKVVETIRPGQPQYQGTWTDPKPMAGVHYYYIRVTQADGELAWASPMWIDSE